MNIKFYKKLFIISLMLTCIGVANAKKKPCNPACSYFSPYLQGFYVGASAAATSNTSNNHLTFDSFEVEDAYLYNRHQYGNAIRVQPGFLIGYRHVINNFWLIGGEFQANYLKSYLNLSSVDYINNVMTFNNQYALQLRGGVSLTCNSDNLIYGLLGVSLTNANIKTIFNNDNENIGNLGSLQMQSINSNHHLSGLKIGVGYEKCLLDHLSLRIDYSHTQYGSFNENLISSEFFEIMDPLGKMNIKQSVDMLGLSLIFTV